MNYLHEAVIGLIDTFIEQKVTFSAWDVTVAVRELNLRPEDVNDSDVYVNKYGEEFVQVEHSRIKSLVHLYMKNYDPTRISKTDNGKYISYTPIDPIIVPAAQTWGQIISSINPAPANPPIPANLPVIDTTPTITWSPGIAPAISTKTAYFCKNDQKLLESTFNILKQKGII